jgi:NTE family protein
MIDRQTENVLVLQGGGSLGAFACGVFKALYKAGVNFDLVGGTSIGAVNAAVICGSDDPAKRLEDFWIEVAESSYQFFPEVSVPYYDHDRHAFGTKILPAGPVNAVMFGVPKMFVPRWQVPGDLQPKDWWTPAGNWTHFYSHEPLAQMLEKYVDFDKLGKAGGRGGGTRLIITAVDVMTAKSLKFDSARMEIKTKHVLASCAYSSYGFPWVQVEPGVYAWDGGLLSNTPLKELVEASPRNNKNVYIVENYPRKIDRLPADWGEVLDRTRDIIFSDKTVYDLRSWKHMSRQVDLIEKLYAFFERNGRDMDPALADRIRQEYEELVGRHGTEILAVYRIARRRMDSPYLLKNADFTVKTVRDLIAQGEQRAAEKLKGAADDMEPGELLKLLDEP